MSRNRVKRLEEGLGDAHELLQQASDIVTRLDHENVTMRNLLRKCEVELSGSGLSDELRGYLKEPAYDPEDDLNKARDAFALRRLQREGRP